MSVKVYIDGNSGTTGLRIHSRLSERSDVELLSLPDDKRKDPLAKKEIYSAADIVFFCLPDDAARESALLAQEVGKYHRLRIIDTSTAHRTEPGWAYGFSELSDDFRRQIESSDKIAVPGCHASGFIVLVKPLIDSGLLKRDALLSCFSLTGYSGGGKKMIAQYEDADRDILFSAPRIYGLGQTHKHLKEMRAITGIDAAPIFCPTVGDFYSGMLVSVPVPAEFLNGTLADIQNMYKNTYNTDIVKYCEDLSDGSGFISACALSGKDSMRVSVSGNDDRILLTALYDNLGKGASGAAVQCFNIVNGIPETEGLSL